MWCQLLAKWLKVSAIRERPVQRCSEVFRFGAEGQEFVVEIDFKFTFSFLFVEIGDSRHNFVLLILSFQVWMYLPLYRFSWQQYPGRNASHVGHLRHHSLKEARNQSQSFTRKSISRNTTHRQSYHLQAMLTGVKRWKAKAMSEKVNNHKTAMKRSQTPTATNKTIYLAQLHAYTEASELTAQITRT